METVASHIVGCDNTSCGPHLIFIYEGSKIMRNKVASLKLWAMITQVVGHGGGVGGDDGGGGGGGGVVLV